MEYKLPLLTAIMACAVLVGCVSLDKTLVNDAGQHASCQNTGWGYIGVPIAYFEHAKCLERAEKSGYKQAGK